MTPRLAITIGLLLVCSGCPRTPSSGKPTTIRLTISTEPVTVDRIAPKRRRFGQLELLAAYDLDAQDLRFGGLSGLELSKDGKQLYAVSDRGRWFSARLELDAGSGALKRLFDWRSGPIITPKGVATRGREGDAESIARDADGALCISFEQRHRIWCYPRGLDKPPRRSIPMPAELSNAPRNGGLEGIVALPDGRWLVFSERLRARKNTLRGWLLSTTGRPPAPLEYLVRDDFAPVDLALLPGGDVLVLERYFSLFSGIKTRIRRIAKAAIEPGATLAPAELARFDGAVLTDNFEGMAVFHHVPSGRTLIFIVSDDNFRKVQRTLLYQLALPRRSQ